MARHQPKINPNNMPDAVDLEYTNSFYPVIRSDKRIVVAWGGRASGKTWGFCQLLLIEGIKRPIRCVCVRETMASMDDSVYQELCDAIHRLNLENFYTIESKKIRGNHSWPRDPLNPKAPQYSEFIFKGIRDDPYQIKGLAGITHTFCDEAANISEQSWDLLEPTIFRNRGCKMYISFNPEKEDSYTWQHWVIKPPIDVDVVKMNYVDNQWLEPELLSAIEHLKTANPKKYRHIYLGEPIKHLEGVVYEQELLDAEAEGRIADVKYQPGYPVEAFWDLGTGNAMAVWLAQKVGQKFHIINYIEHIGKTFDYVMGQLTNCLPYGVDKYWLPHDGKSRHHLSEFTAEQQARNKGKSVTVLPRLGISEGIDAVRTLFPLMYFDQKRCEHGLKMLSSYHYNTKPSIVNGKLKFSDHPVHDETSNCADALRYLALSLKTPKEKKRFIVNMKVPSIHGNRAWMRG